MLFAYHFFRIKEHVNEFKKINYTETQFEGYPAVGCTRQLVSFHFHLCKISRCCCSSQAASVITASKCQCRKRSQTHKFSTQQTQTHKHMHTHFGNFIVICCCIPCTPKSMQSTPLWAEWEWRLCVFCVCLFVRPNELVVPVLGGY